MKKVFAISIIMTIITIFSVSYTFAANNTMDNIKNGVRNVVGGAENMVEGAGSAIGSTIRDGVNTVGNGAQNTMGAMTDDRGDDGYTATRTSSTTGTDGSNNVARTFTWVVIGITAVGIVVLLWSYFRQNNKNDLYIDSNNR